MKLPTVVHLDLKGAPWKLDYLCHAISFMKENGAWGVLLEWEDTFPFTGDLINIGSLGGCSRDAMYSQAEVKRIIQFIKDKGMEPIQLVQTIGHMEYVLKHGQYKRLRELARSPSSLCPTRTQSRPLVEAMVTQILDLQPDANYIHIGADEVWCINMCADCQQKSQNEEHPAAFLFLDHVKAVASFIKAKHPHINILMWDDMMRNYPVEILKASELGSLVQPVVWNYSPKETFFFDIKMWERYSFAFPLMWVASAYKGANGSCQLVCVPERYASNQRAWRDELAVYEAEIKFGGIILTGWSRYDHYAVLCELLPEALPSLATCLRMWNLPDGFSVPVCESLDPAAWPGYEASCAVRAAHQARCRATEFFMGDQVNTWLNIWQIEHDYTSPVQAEIITNTASMLSAEVSRARASLADALQKLTGRRSADEAVRSHLAAAARRLADLAAAAAARAAAPAGLTPKYAHPLGTPPPDDDQ